MRPLLALALASLLVSCASSKPQPAAPTPPPPVDDPGDDPYGGEAYGGDPYGGESYGYRQADEVSEPTAYSGPPMTWGQVVVLYNEVADAVCACQDVECVERVTQARSAELEAAGNAQGTPTDAEVEQLTAAANRMGSCVGRLAGG